MHVTSEVGDKEAGSHKPSIRSPLASKQSTRVLLPVSIMQSTLKSSSSKRSKPYVRPIQPKTRVINHFPLDGDIIVTVGLSGLDPEIRFSQTKVQKTFVLDTPEFMQLATKLNDQFNEQLVLSSTQVSGGYYGCVVHPTVTGLEFQHKLDSYRCPRDEEEVEDCISRRFSLTKTAVSTLCQKMNIILASVRALQENRHVFECMYSLIVDQLRTVENDSYGSLDDHDNFDNAYRLFRVKTPSSYLVRLYLEQKPVIKTKYQLYEVVDICYSQIAHLRHLMFNGTKDDIFFDPFLHE